MKYKADPMESCIVLFRCTYIFSRKSIFHLTVSLFALCFRLSDSKLSENDQVKALEKEVKINEFNEFG